MTKIQITKLIAGTIASVCASSVVHTIVRTNSAPKNLPNKVAIVIGSFVIASMVAYQAEKYTHKQIDDLVEAWEKLKSSL